MRLFNSLILVVFLFGVSLSCIFAQNPIVRDDGVPEALGKNDKEVLLCVIRGRRSFDKYLIKNVEKVYNGKYEFVFREDLEDSKYENKKIYRYIFDSKPYFFKDKETIRAGGDTFFVSDRIAEKSYWNKISSDFFAKLIKKCMKDLEAKRIKEQGGF